MPPPPFDVVFSASAEKAMSALEHDRSRQAKFKKVRKAVRCLREPGPSHTGLRTHPFESLTGPNGETVFQSYVENATPGAWRIWWVYGPDLATITIIHFGEHPN